MDYSALGSLLPRYFRALGDAGRELEGVEIGKYPLSRVLWAPDFYAAPGCAILRHGTEPEVHKLQGLYPMDIASALAVMLLAPLLDSPVRVLDLCCCPGSKLGMITQRLHSDSVVVGVDISEPRLNVCRSLIRSWNEPLIRFKTRESARMMIFHGDGTKFSENALGSLIYDSNITKEEIAKFGAIKKRNKSYRDREAKRLKLIEASMCSQEKANDELSPDTGPNISEFDYVLVDAECTHDASYKHMQFIPGHGEEGDTPHQKHDKPQASLTHGTDLMSNASTAALQALQQSLLMNGFRNLKSGGELVYSTCSQSRLQNEDIVQWLLDQTPGQAELVPVLDSLRAALPEIPHSAPPSSSSSPSLHTGKSTECSEEEDGSFGTAEFRFTLGNAQDPLRLLRLDLPQLMLTLQREYPTDESRRALSVALCQAVTAQTRPAVEESELLRGTAKLSYRGGMSGHYLAKIRKL